MIDVKKSSIVIGAICVLYKIAARKKNGNLNYLKNKSNQCFI